jgi:para-nitrobenzyl esterase
MASRKLAALLGVWVTLVAALVIGDTPAEAAPERGALVRTDAGWVRGHVAAQDVTFSGIPYAAPPVGERRWTPPLPARPWRGVRDATVPGSPCPRLGSDSGSGSGQPVTVVGDEDCLYLNVTVPRGARPGARLPVMVWVHGGEFASGAGSEYDGSRLATAGDVIVVTVNYRLGPLGFLASPVLDAEGHPSGNYGLQDQAAALRWVRRNAVRFGGDPRSVTLFGQSAGARSVCAHLAAPDSRGLFHKAIIQSGPCANALVTKPVADERGRRVAAGLGCASSADVARCLRGRPVADVLTAVPDQGSALVGEYRDRSWMPVVGPPVLPGQPLDALAHGTATGIPLLVGTTREEMSPFVGYRYDARGNPLTEPQYRALVAAAFGPDAAVILARYPARDHSSPAVALTTLLTDWGGTVGACPMLRTAQVGAGHSRVFAYELAEDSGLTPEGFPLGAFHGWDLPFLWDLSMPNGYPELTAAQQALSRQLLAYWTTFARTGDPNRPGSVPWPRFGATGADDGPVQSLAAGTDGITQVPYADDHQCEFWLRRSPLARQVTVHAWTPRTRNRRHRASMPCPSSERLRPSRTGSMVQIPNPMRTRSGMKVPWVWYTVRPSTRHAAVELLRSSVISHARSRVKSSSKSSYGDSTTW